MPRLSGKKFCKREKISRPEPQEAEMMFRRGKSIFLGFVRDDRRGKRD